MNELYQQMIIDHSRLPYGHAATLAGSYATASNPLCGDRIACGIEIDAGVIRRVGHQVSGCSLSKASTSLMAKAIEGLTIEQFHDMCRHFMQAATGEEALTGKFACLNGVKAFPMRVKCITFPWHAVSQAIKQMTYPVKMDASVIIYWSDRVMAQMASGIDLNFNQIGCYGWKFDAKVAQNPVRDKARYGYGSWDLYVSEDIISKIEGTLISCQRDDALEKKVIYKHPKAISQCGCGESIFIDE